MNAPKPPAPDPAIAAAQAAEQARAEAGQISQTQQGLNADNASIRRRFGAWAGSIVTNPTGSFTGFNTGSGGSGTGSLPTGFSGLSGIRLGGIGGLA